MACPHVHRCPLFPLFALKCSLRVWQDYYCRASFERCARYKAGLRGEAPPQNLLPNGTLLSIEEGSISP
jgi:hypothetical protein